MVQRAQPVTRKKNKSFTPKNPTGFCDPKDYGNRSIAVSHRIDSFLSEHQVGFEYCNAMIRKEVPARNGDAGGYTAYNTRALKAGKIVKAGRRRYKHHKGTCQWYRLVYPKQEITAFRYAPVRDVKVKKVNNKEELVATKKTKHVARGKIASTIIKDVKERIRQRMIYTASEEELLLALEKFYE